MKEGYYRLNNTPVLWGRDPDYVIKEAKQQKDDVLFILGDSRAEAAIIPELVNKKTRYQAYNIGMQGIYKGYYYWLKNNEVNPDYIILAVSPFSVFTEYKDEAKYKRKLREWELLDLFKLVSKPSTETEKLLARCFNRYTRLSYGFSGFTEVLFYGQVSKYHSPRGWHADGWSGADVHFARTANLQGYSNTMIEEYRDSTAINKQKVVFESMLQDMSSNNISILLVRIPMSDQIRKIENEKYPWFDSYMKKISERYKIKYIISEEFVYNEDNADGSHLNVESAKKYTAEIIDILNE